MTAFAGTGVVFLGMASLASLIKRDLSAMGKWLFIGAVMLLVAGIANVFMQSSALMITIAVLADRHLLGLHPVRPEAGARRPGDELHHRHARRLPEHLQRLPVAARCCSGSPAAARSDASGRPRWARSCSIPNVWVAFAILTALEIVLGIDNIIFISILVGRLPAGAARQGPSPGPRLRDALAAGAAVLAHLGDGSHGRPVHGLRQWHQRARPRSARRRRLPALQGHAGDLRAVEGDHVGRGAEREGRRRRRERVLGDDRADRASSTSSSRSTR